MATALASPELENLETYSLIWLDSSVNYSQEGLAAQKHLRTIINYLKTFQQTNPCLEYIHSIPKEDQIVLIVSGQLGQEIVPRIHQLPQVSSIYVYCMNKKKNEQWAQQFVKVKHVTVQLGELVSKIREDQAKRQHQKLTEPFKLNIISTSIDTGEQPLRHIDNSFHYSRLLIDCLLQTNSALTDKSDLFSICTKYYEGNEHELKILEEFNENYSPSRALWWYTRQTFLYRLLNKALQIQNIELLLLFRFFLRDIERQLEKNRCTSLVNVACGRMMSSEEIQLLKEAVGEFIVISSFLSTGPKHQVQSVLTQMKSSCNLQTVLFEIEADPRLDNIKPFSNVTAHSYFPQEEQTLFMVGSIFRLIDVRLRQNDVWSVRMVLCSENDHQLTTILNQQEYKDALSFGQGFCRLRRFNEAEKYYHHLLKTLPTDHEDSVLYYDALGRLEREKGNYDSSLQWFTKSLEMKLDRLEADHPDIADSYNHIGEIHLEKNECKQASDAFKKAMTIFKKKLGDDHPKVAVCFNHLGDVCQKEKQYSKALDFYQKALAICQKRFSQGHLLLADTYSNLATSHRHLNELDQALDYYNKSLEIYSKSPSPSHVIIGTILKSIGHICESKKHLQQARSYYEKAATSFSRVLSATDPHLVQIQEDIQRVTTTLA